MSYRPITDVWLLGRPKVKYYGAYPCGFLRRARDLLGVHPFDPVLHVCSGMVHEYSNPENGVKPGVAVAGFGPNDATLDIDPECVPDFLQDARKPFPLNGRKKWHAILIDPPYTPEDASNYRCGANVLPTASELLRNGLEAVRHGGRVGVLHYLFPRPPKGVRLVAKVSVSVGYANRDRCFSVFEKPL
jgi:hypothetical protein